VYRDTDGDGTVDVIRKNGGEIVSNSLREILVRDADFATNTQTFEDAELADKI
jgi:hypothetical protein